MFSKSYAISTPVAEISEEEVQPQEPTLPTPNSTAVSDESHLVQQAFIEPAMLEKNTNLIQVDVVSPLNQSTTVTILEMEEVENLDVAKDFLSNDFKNNNENEGTTFSKTSTVSKRHSLPPPIGGSKSSLLFSSNSNAPSLIPKTRKSTSPRHSRSSLSSSISSLSAVSSSAANGSLLIAPLTTQLHSLKARNRALESLLIQEKEGRISDLGKARGRIENLEKVLQGSERVLEGRSKEKLEADGWESEVLVVREELVGAQNKVVEFQSKIEGLELAYKVEKEKRYRSKQIVERLRLELRARRCAEKWELGIIDVEDRRREVDEVGLEFEVGMLRMQVLVDKVEREDLEAIIAERDQRIAKLSFTRAQLVKANETIDTVRSELVDSKTDIATLRKASILLEKEVNSLKKKTSETTGSKADAKELAELKKSLEKEKKLREAEIEELKSSLKQTQLELKTSLLKKSTSTVSSKVKRSAITAPLPSVATLAARKRRSMTREASVPGVEESENDAEEYEDIEMDGEGDSSAILLKAEAKARALDRVISGKKGSGEVKAKKVKISRPVSPEGSSDEEADEEVEEEEEVEEDSISVEEVEEEFYRPSLPKKSKSTSTTNRGVSSKSSKSKSKILEDSSAMSSKKRKASIGGGIVANEKVLSETKSGNNDGIVVAVKEKKVIAVSKKTSAGSEKAEVPAKKKQRKLFAGTTKFQWGGIENANINGLIPSNLSPIKFGSSGAGGLASAFSGAKGSFGKSIY